MFLLQKARTFAKAVGFSVPEQGKFFEHIFNTTTSTLPRMNIATPKKVCKMICSLASGGVLAESSMNTHDNAWLHGIYSEDLLCVFQATVNSYIICIHFFFWEVRSSEKQTSKNTLQILATLKQTSSWNSVDQSSPNGAMGPRCVVSRCRRLWVSVSRTGPQWQVGRRCVRNS